MCVYDIGLFYHLNMPGYTFRENNSTIFCFASLLNWGELLKERICSTRSKFFHLKVGPSLEGVATWKSQKLSLLLLMAEKHGSGPIHSKIVTFCDSRYRGSYTSGHFF